jgi:hypothetical protein
MEPDTSPETTTAPVESSNPRTVEPASLLPTPAVPSASPS